MMATTVSHQTPTGLSRTTGLLRVRPYSDSIERIHGVNRVKWRVTTYQTFAQVVQYIHDWKLSFGDIPCESAHGFPGRD